MNIGIIYENRAILGLSDAQFDAVERACHAACAQPRAMALLNMPLGAEQFNALKPELTALYGGAPGMHWVLALLKRLPELKARYARHSIPDEILKSTLSDISIWMDVCMRESGQWGLKRSEWLNNHFNFELFRIGRLQFRRAGAQIRAVVYRSDAGEVIALAEDGARYDALGDMVADGDRPDAGGFTASLAEDARTVTGYPIERRGRAASRPITLEKDAWRPVLKAGDTILEIHIAEGEPLKIAAVQDSLARAPGFYKKHLGQGDIKAFTCGSWLMDWAIGAMRPDGNIAAFQNLFYCVPTAWGDGQMMERVFGGPVSDWTSAPADTALRRAIRDWYLSGQRCRGAQGFILI